MPRINDWNVVVTTQEGGYAEARRLLAEFGTVGTTDFFNVLVMRVREPPALLDQLDQVAPSLPGLRPALSRVMPVSLAFDFQDVAQFETRALAAADLFAPCLAGHTFHVRMHRRGFRGRLSSQEEERGLDHHILRLLQQRHSGARVSFDDPDYILALESVGQRAGFSLWTRELRRRYPLLKLD